MTQSDQIRLLPFTTKCHCWTKHTKAPALKHLKDSVTRLAQQREVTPPIKWLGLHGTTDKSSPKACKVISVTLNKTLLKIAASKYMEKQKNTAVWQAFSESKSTMKKSLKRAKSVDCTEETLYCEWQSGSWRVERCNVSSCQSFGVHTKRAKIKAWSKKASDAKWWPL